MNLIALVAFIGKVVYTVFSFKSKGRELYGYGSHWLVYLAQEAQQYKVTPSRSLNSSLIAKMAVGFSCFWG